MAAGEALREERPVGLLQEIVGAGVVAGIAGGSAMAAFLLVWSAWRGRGMFSVVQAMGGLFYGHSAVGGGGGPIFWGLAIHFALSIALGVLFAAIVSRQMDPLAAVSGGLFYGLAVWAAMTFVVVPLVDPTLRELVADGMFGWLAAHVPFGIALGVAPQLRRLARGEPALRRE